MISIGQVQFKSYGLFTFISPDSDSDPISVPHSRDWNLGVKSLAYYSVAIWFAVQIGIGIRIRQCREANTVHSEHILINVFVALLHPTKLFLLFFKFFFQKNSVVGSWWTAWSPAYPLHWRKLSSIPSIIAPTNHFTPMVTCIYKSNCMRG